MRYINIINKSTVVANDDFTKTIAACQKQIDVDFKAWVGTTKNNILTVKSEDISKERIYILDDVGQANILGYHVGVLNIPVGYVFAKTAAANGKAWSTVFSRELLGQLVDPFVNLTASITMGNKPAIIAYEVCDPVDGGEYAIDGIKVANFVLPNWYLDGSIAPYDFMVKLAAPLNLDVGGHALFQTTLGTWLLAFKSPLEKQAMSVHRIGHSKFSREHRRLKLIGKNKFKGKPCETLT